MSDLLPAKQSSLPPPDASQTYVMSDESAGASSGMPLVRIRRMLRFLLRFWWIPTVTLLLGTGAAIGFVLHKAPTYVSSATMWETEKMVVPGGAAFTEDQQSYYGTQMALLESDHMLELAVANMQANSTNSPSQNKGKEPPTVKIKASHKNNTRVIVLQASSTDARYAQAVLNALMRVYQTYRQQIRAGVSGSTYQSIAAQAEKYGRDLQENQRALEAFQKTNNLVILQEEGTVSGGYLARLKTQLSDLEFESKLLESAASDAQRGGQNNSQELPSLLNSLASGLGSSAPSASDQRPAAFSDLELLKIQREKLIKIYKPKHPKIAKLDADIDRAQKLIDLYRNQTQEKLEATRKSVKLRRTNILAAITEWEKKVIDAKARLSLAEGLKENVARSQALYDRLLQMQNNVDLSRNISQDNIEVLEPASLGTRSRQEDIAMIVLGAFVGLALGVGIVLLIELTDDRFTSPQEVTAKFGDSIVGLVPEVRALTEGKSEPILLDPTEPHLLAESYRSLRSALLYLPVSAERPKVLLVTSAMPGEGKSTVAANLARTMALGGSRVLLVDADLRKGQLHKILKLAPEPGLADVLGHSNSCEQVFQTNCLSTLSFIARGKSEAHPGDSFLSSTFNDLLSKWRESFDYIVIDCCPVFASDDVATLAPKIDGTLFVVRHKYSRNRPVREALELLAQRQAKVLGIVFNRAEISSSAYEYYKNADYYSKRDTGTMGR